MESSSPIQTHLHSFQRPYKQTVGTTPQDVAPGIPVLVGWLQEHCPAVGEARVVVLAVHAEYRPAGTRALADCGPTSHGPGLGELCHRSLK